MKIRRADLVKSTVPSLAGSPGLKGIRRKHRAGVGAGMVRKASKKVVILEEESQRVSEFGLTSRKGPKVRAGRHEDLRDEKAEGAFGEQAGWSPGRAGKQRDPGRERR